MSLRIFFSVCTFLVLPLSVVAFSTMESRGVTITTTSKRDTALNMGLFGSGEKSSSKGNILDDLFGQNKQSASSGGAAAGSSPTIVLEIPVQKIKPRPLRFFLQIYIVGQQNTQESQSWLPREADGEEGGLQVYYKDGTGMCNIVLDAINSSIRIERHGQRPSLEYMLQESLLLHGVLDELNQVAFEVEDVEENQRLLILDKVSLDTAREKLPARQE